jgi:broad specificity phosphatase PhoE
MNQFYAINKTTLQAEYKSASIFMLKDTIALDGKEVSDYIIAEDTNMKYISRVAFVDGTCIYNNRDFWLNEASTILENYDTHEVLDFINEPVDRLRFETEYNSNVSRISNIDHAPGEIEYNSTVGREFIALFLEECKYTKFVGITTTQVGEKLHSIFNYVLTGAYRDALVLMDALERDAFLTDERIAKYRAMLVAANAITPITNDADYKFTTAPVQVFDEYTKVFTIEGLTITSSGELDVSREHSLYYVPLHMVDGDKLLLVLRHADRGSDDSASGDLTDSGIARAQKIGTRLAFAETPTDGHSTSILPNDAHYFATEISRAQHTAQLIAAARGDTNSASEDYSGITINQPLLEGYRFLKDNKKPDMDVSVTAVLKKYARNPNELTQDELVNCFGVNSAEEARTKLAADTKQFTEEMFAVADKTLNVFITHDYFIGPFFSGITDGRYTGSDSDPWVKFCSGVAIILHSDKSYDAVPVYAS